MKKVSIILPNYNHAPYLRERLESIWQQDYPNFEVILLDDASTDESVIIMKEYASRPQTKVLLTNEHNSGNTFIQWRRGLEQATGDYVWIAESDDIARPNLLSTLVEAIEREDAVLAFARNEWIDRSGNLIHRSQDRRWNRSFCEEGTNFIRHYLLGYTYICNASGVVFKRANAMKVNMEEIIPFTASGDRLFWIRMAQQGRVAYINQTLNYFRQHGQKVSGSAENKGLNIVQDHTIYRMIASDMALTDYDKRIICGYHWQAIHRPAVSAEGRQKAMKAWRAETEFNWFSYIQYLIHRIREKC